MKRILIVTLLLLSACGHQEIPAPGTVDYLGETGTRVSFDQDWQISGASLESYFKDAQQCMLDKGFISSPVPGPLIRVVDFMPHGYDGYTEPSGLIVVWSGMPSVVQHEAVHYILLVSGQEWIDHSNPAFQCSVTVHIIVTIN